MGIRDTVWAKQLVLRPSRIAKKFGTQHLVSRRDQFSSPVVQFVFSLKGKMSQKKCFLSLLNVLQHVTQL